MYHHFYLQLKIHNNNHHHFHQYIQQTPTTTTTTTSGIKPSSVKLKKRKKMILSIPNLKAKNAWCVFSCSFFKHCRTTSEPSFQPAVPQIYSSKHPSSIHHSFNHPPSQPITPYFCCRTTIGPPYHCHRTLSHSRAMLEEELKEKS